MYADYGIHIQSFIKFKKNKFINNSRNIGMGFWSTVLKKKIMLLDSSCAFKPILRP